MTRRVVTGLDEQGRSTVLVDGAALPMSGSGALVWRTEGLPADNSARADIAQVDFSMALMEGGGTMFMVVDFPPGQVAPMHATNTVDYIVVLEGRITLGLETGDVVLGPGDCLVDRGVIHSWRNDGAETVRMVTVIVPAKPLYP
jgi:quercetin dioxygenase-like cupin family protein